MSNIATTGLADDHSGRVAASDLYFLAPCLLTSHMVGYKQRIPYGRRSHELGRLKQYNDRAATGAESCSVCYYAEHGDELFVAETRWLPDFV